MPSIEFSLANTPHKRPRHSAVHGDDSLTRTASRKCSIREILLLLLPPIIMKKKGGKW